MAKWGVIGVAEIPSPAYEKKKNLSVLGTFEEGSFSQNRMANIVFKQIFVLIKLFDDIRNLDNDHGGALKE